MKLITLPINVLKCLHLFLQLYFPINVPNRHWLTGDLELSTWKITIYDSLDKNVFKSEVSHELTEFTKTLGRLLHQCRYWEHAKVPQPEQFKLQWDYADNVPRQKGELGDCGVWVCVMMYMLSKGNSISTLSMGLKGNGAIEFAWKYRLKMGNFFHKNGTNLKLDYVKV